MQAKISAQKLGMNHVAIPVIKTGSLLPFLLGLGWPDHSIIPFIAVLRGGEEETSKPGRAT